MNKNRLEAFSDGVLAIIITIMVLEFKVPHGGNINDLEPLIPVFLSYLLSFIYVGIYWGNHHHLLHTVRNITPGMIWANMTLLFFLSLIPFGTDWMGENHFASHTVAMYGLILFLSGGAYGLLQTIVEKNSVDKDGFNAAFSKMKIKAFISTILYLCAIAFAFYFPPISQIIFVVVAFIWLIPDRNIEKAILN